MERFLIDEQICIGHLSSEFRVALQIPHTSMSADRVKGVCWGNAVFGLTCIRGRVCLRLVSSVVPDTAERVCCIAQRRSTVTLGE